MAGGGRMSMASSKHRRPHLHGGRGRVARATARASQHRAGRKR